MVGGILGVLAVALATVTTLSVLALASVSRWAVQNAPAMSDVVGLSICIGFSSGTGLLLLITALYLDGVVVMRHDRSFVQVRWLGLFFPLLFT